MVVSDGIIELLSHVYYCELCDDVYELYSEPLSFRNDVMIVKCANMIVGCVIVICWWNILVEAHSFRCVNYLVDVGQELYDWCNVVDCWLSSCDGDAYFCTCIICHCCYDKGNYRFRCWGPIIVPGLILRLGLMLGLGVCLVKPSS